MGDRAGGLGEFDRIRRFFAPLAGPEGLGLADDAALVELASGRRLVVTTDAIVEGVHYLPQDPPELVAAKLLRVNLSDLAAMGAVPRHYLLTTALPPACGEDWLARFAQGLDDDQRRFGVALIGGDSVATPGPAMLSLTAIGEVAAGAEIRRGTARAGDRIWVSGTIGDASLGLAVLEGSHAGLAAPHRAYLVDRYRLPQPRVTLGPALAGIAHAMLDVSDGLLADLGHIGEASRLACVVFAEALPLSPAARAAVASSAAAVGALATGGDDYELLFTAPDSATESLNRLSASLAVPITAIGTISNGEGVRLVDGDDNEIRVAALGYRHF
jgi:thiamine-monophosphate kinase